jgi:hypothetical protein
MPIAMDRKVLSNVGILLLQRLTPSLRLTRMSAGPVAYGGTLAMSGVKKRLTKKHSDTTSAVIPAGADNSGGASVKTHHNDVAPA